MNRFRVWDIKKKKRYISVSGTLNSLIVLCDTGKLLVATPETMYGDKFIIRPTKIDEFEIQFSTGLFDKNNKEIFEGDIVECWYDDGFKTEVGLVKFGQSNYPAFEIYPSEVTDCNALHSYHESGNIKIIGNRFENPELLRSE